MNAYIEQVQYLRDHIALHAGFVRPPLGPGWLLYPFVQVLGLDNGYNLWASTASMLPAIPVYLLASRIGKWPAIFATGFILIDLVHAEMIVTGALPLIGFSLLGMCWWAMGSLAEQWSWKHAVVLTCCLGLIPYINQTTAGLAAITIPVYMAALLWYNRHQQYSAPIQPPPSQSALRLTPPWGVLVRIGTPAFVGSLIAFGALPWYVDVAPGSSHVSWGGGRLFYPSQPFDVGWVQFVFALIVGIWVIRKARQPWLRSLAVVTILLGALAPWLSYDETIINIFYRSKYLIQIPFYVCISWLIFKVWMPGIKEYRWVIPAGFTVSVLLMFAGYVNGFYGQAGYSLMIGPEADEALQIVRNENPQAGVISNSFTMSLWIAALNRTYSPFIVTAAPPPHYVEEEERVRCVLNWIPGCDVQDAVEKLGVGYALLEERFPNVNPRTNKKNYGAPPDQWEVTDSAPWLSLVYSEGTVRLYRVITTNALVPR